jgi:LacI family transcriptional regulator
MALQAIFNLINFDQGRGGIAEMKKITLADLAREAGVGTATVERFLNSRGNVGAQTAERIELAARKLGYDRRLPKRYHGVIRIEAILMRPDTPFFSRLNEAFARIAATLDPSVVVHRTFLDELDPHGLALHIADPGFRRSGLIIAAPDRPEVKAALRETKAAGVVVVQIVSRKGGSDEVFVGIDNYAAGRSAAYYMTHMLKARHGRLVALCHSGAYEVHRGRIRGFSDYLERRGDPAHSFEVVMFGLDDRLRSAEMLEEALNRHSDIIGLYNAGGANSGVASVLERRGLGQSIMWIGHELTQNTRRWLETGLMNIVFDQAPETQARRAVDIVLRRIGFLDAEVPNEPVRFLTINSENL